MINKLVKLQPDDAVKIIEDYDLATKIKSSNEPLFKLQNTPSRQKNDDLVDLEIALRNCERTGVFDNSR